jgi:outer membrane lipoprotein-sorting protein
MVRKITLVAILMLALVASLIAAEMTADGLIAKYFTATGGEQNVRAIKSMTMKGTMFAQGQSLEMKVSYVLPGKSFVEIGMGGMTVQTVGTNGKEAWMKHPMLGNVFLSGSDKDDAMRQANMFPLLDYKKSGAKVKFLGEDMVKGAKAYKLEYVGADNDTVVYSFDATTFLTLKEKRTDATVMASDYRKVGGIMIPYKINVQAGAQSMMMTIDTIAVNIAIPDSLFVMPKDAKSLDSLKTQMQQMQGGGAGGGGK